MVRSSFSFPISLAVLNTIVETTVTNAILVLKYLYQYRLLTSSGHPTPPSTSKIISGLARRLDTIKHPTARACVVWLVGQYSPVDIADTIPAIVPGIADWAPDVLRRVAKSFPAEVNWLHFNGRSDSHGVMVDTSWRPRQILSAFKY